MHSTMLPHATPHTPPHTPPHTAAPPHTAPVPSTYFVSFAIRFVRKQASSIALRRVPPWPRKLRPLAFRDTYSHMATTIPLTVCAMAVVHKDALRTNFVLRDHTVSRLELELEFHMHVLDLHLFINHYPRAGLL